MAIFNFWGNETDRAHSTTPNTGSGVVFFNHTRRSKNLLKAWSEAMAWKGNYQAPDDQVLDKLLKEGGWLRRVSAGWLPASYLRTMPSYYRGISPVVIDHDHGNAPGINGGHSEVKPELPPVRGAAHPNYDANPIHPNFHPHPNPNPNPNPKPNPNPRCLPARGRGPRRATAARQGDHP